MSFAFRSLCSACIACLGLSACLPVSLSSGSATPAAPRDTATTAPLCTPGIWNHLKGQPRSAAEDVPAPMRIIAPGQPVTADHNPSRTNFELDENGTITRVFCG